MTVFQTSLALVATNIGGGILGLPYAYYHLGLINGLLVNFAVALMAHFSAMMYIRVGKLTKQESIY